MEDVIFAVMILNPALLEILPGDRIVDAAPFYDSRKVCAEVAPGLMTRVPGENPGKWMRDHGA